MGNSDKSTCERLLQKWREAVHVLINKMLVETRIEEQQQQWKGSWWEADMSLRDLLLHSEAQGQLLNGAL